MYSLTFSPLTEDGRSDESLLFVGTSAPDPTWPFWVVESWGETVSVRSESKTGIGSGLGGVGSFHPSQTRSWILSPTSLRAETASLWEAPSKLCPFTSMIRWPTYKTMIYCLSTVRGIWITSITLIKIISIPLDYPNILWRCIHPRWFLIWKLLRRMDH